MPKALLTDIHISLSNAQIPFYQILDSNKKILFQNTSNANFHKITQLSQYTVSLNELIEKNSSLMTKEQNFFIFIGNAGLIYAIKKIYKNQIFIGKIVFGGYKISENQKTNLFPPEYKELITKLPSLSSNKIKNKITLVEKTIDNLRKKHLDDFSCLYETVSYDLSKKYSLSELAKKHYLSEKKISRLFQIHTGMTFKKYYLKMRVDKAIELKKKNIYTDEEITEMVGYWDVRSLKRAIRRMEQYW